MSLTIRAGARVAGIEGAGAIAEEVGIMDAGKTTRRYSALASHHCSPGDVPMMTELPDKFDTVRGSLRYSTMDTGDRYVTFGVDPEDFDLAMAGRIVSADVDGDRLDQLLGEIRDLGGVRFVVTPRSQQ
jgi:hypothetical protein